MSDPTESTESDEPTDTDTEESSDSSNTETEDGSTGGVETEDPCSEDQKTTEHLTIRETNLEVLYELPGQEESASVTLNDGMVTVTGVIGGNNGCYTARLDDAIIQDDQLVVSIESYEDTAEDEVCSQAIIAIEYKATVVIHGEEPASVRVVHNGEQVTTEQL